jgi:hypothetical protein
MKPAPLPWSHEEIATLREIAPMGLTTETVSPRLTRSVEAAKMIARRLGITVAPAGRYVSNKLWMEDVPALRAMMEEGLPWDEIQRRLGGGRWSIRQIKPKARRLGFRWERKYKPNLAADQKMLELYGQGLTMLQICRVMKRSYSATKARAKRLGIWKKPTLVAHNKGILSPFWTEHHEGLRRMIEIDEMTASEAARILGTTKNAVMGHAQRTGILFPGGPQIRTFDQRVDMLPTFPERMDQCRWADGTPGDEGFYFCGQPGKSASKPYCEKHHAIVYRAYSDVLAEKIMEARAA